MKYAGKLLLVMACLMLLAGVASASGSFADAFGPSSVDEVCTADLEIGVFYDNDCNGV